MTLFALPKTLTDLVKAFKLAAIGQSPRKSASGWEFVDSTLDPSERWAAQGVFVGAAEPPLVSYAQWAATGEGYWAWVDISGQPQTFSVSVTSAGGVVISGQAAHASARAIEAGTVAVISAGGITISGAASTAQTQTVSVLSAGGAVASGAASVSQTRTLSVISSGGAVAAGSASVSLNGVSVLAVVASGGMVAAGSAQTAQTRSPAVVSAGGVVISGSAAVAGAAVGLSINPGSGTYAEPQMVTITDPSGGWIVITLDGSDPLDYFVTNTENTIALLDEDTGELVTIGDVT